MTSGFWTKLSCGAGLALTGCDRTSQASESLVGATKQPSTSDLRKETVIIARKGGANAEDLLNIEIRPTNQIVAMHLRGHNKTLVAQESLEVAPEGVERVRKSLWRLRPDDGAPAQRTVPVGCEYIDDGGWDWAVVYVREVNPANLLQFSLPPQQDCKAPASTEARALIAAAIRTLPRSEVIERFPPLANN